MFYWKLRYLLLILSPCPMLEGTPFSMSFSMLLSNANAATLKKNPCTFSPENMVGFFVFFLNQHFFVAFHLIYVEVMYYTALGVQ